MSFQDCLIVERADGWWIVAGSLTDTLGHDASPDELATCADVLIKQAQLKNCQCVIAPAATSCYFTKLTPDTDVDVRDRAALLYELEDHLPIDAESMVADYSVVPSTLPQKTLSAVAIESNRWQAIAEALESSLIPVRAIVPSTVLATRAVCQRLNLTDKVELLFADKDHCDLVTVNAEVILDWKHSRVDAVLLNRHKLLATNPDHSQLHRVLAIGGSDDQKATIASVHPNAEFDESDLEDQWRDGAELTLIKPAEHWFDLRRDQLGPTDPLRPIQSQLRWATIAATVFLLALVVGGWWRSHRIETEISRVKEQQRELFREAFPNTTVRGDVAFRVRREHRSVLGLRGGAAEEVDVPVSAAMVIRSVIRSLPNETRYRFTKLSVLNGHISLEVEVRDFVDAGEISDALSKAGFTVQPPQITKKEPGAKFVGAVVEGDWVGVKESASGNENLSTAFLPERIAG